MLRHSTEYLKQRFTAAFTVIQYLNFYIFRLSVIKLCENAQSYATPVEGFSISNQQWNKMDPQIVTEASQAKTEYS